MPDRHLYEQMRQQFDDILQQDRRRRQRIQRALLVLHLLLVLCAPVYVTVRNQAMSETIGVFFSEAFFVLWVLLAASFLLHLGTVVFLTRSRVAETVHESLLLMAAQQERTEAAQQFAEKRKREPLDSDGTDGAFDGERNEPDMISRRYR